MKKLKCIFIAIVLCLSTLPITGCYDASSIETLAYVVAMGIDKGSNNNIKLTLQFAILNNSDSTGSGSSQSSASTIIDVEASTIDSGISLINNHISKKVNLSHCKAVIISETLAYQGVSNYLFTLINNVQLRPGCNVIISRCDASDFLYNSSPVLESISARFYELILNSSEYTGYTEDILISDFYSDILSSSCQAIAILGGISSEETQVNTSDLNGNYKADEVPIQANNTVENMGMAVFNGDTLVGELNNTETIAHLIMCNKLQNATITIPNPFNYNDSISVYIALSKNTKNNVDMVNSYPYIKSKIYITGNVMSMDDTLDLSNKDIIKTIEDYVSTYLEESITSYLYKTSKELRADIDDFGRYLLPNYLFWNDWIASDWLNNYENAFFDVEINTTIQSGYLFSKV